MRGLAMNFNEVYQEYVESFVGQDVLRVPEQINGMIVEVIPKLKLGPQDFKEVWLPESVKRIESYAFDEWRQLKEVHLPKDMEYIGAYAFSETKISELHLPDGIKYLGNSICYGCHSLESVHLGNELETIGIGAFWDCTALRQMVIPVTVRKIMDSAFQDCQNLVYIRFEGKVEAIAPNAFLNCNNIVLVESSQVEQKIEEINQLDVIHESLIKSKSKKNNKSKRSFMSFFIIQAIPVIPNLVDIDITDLDYPEVRRRAELYTQKLVNLKQDISKEKSVKERIELLLDLAVQAKFLGQFRTALDLCEQALSLKPANGVAFYNLAKILYLVGQGTAVLKALAFAKLNVYQAHISKLYGPAGHVYLDAYPKRQRMYMGEILAYRSWAAGHSGEKPVTGYELLCELEGKKRLEEMAVNNSIPFSKMMLRRQLTEKMNQTIDHRISQKLNNIIHNENQLNDMAKEYAYDLYRKNSSLNNEVGKFDDDVCYK